MNQTPQSLIDKRPVEAETFQVVFNGIKPGLPAAEATARLAVLFKVPSEKIASLLANPGYVVKKSCPPELASRYKAAIENAGGICGLVSEKKPLVPPEVGLVKPTSLRPKNTEATSKSAIPKSCPKCGADVAASAQLCQACDAALAATAKLNASSSKAKEELADDGKAMELFIGKKYQYFKEKWEIAEQKKSRQSWNWAAFIFGFLWMAYRKMYLFSWVFIGTIAAVTVIEHMFGVSDKRSSTFGLVVGVMLGLYGNYLYKIHVEDKVKKITAANGPEQSENELLRQGSTSFLAPIGFLAAIFVFLFIFAVVTGG